MKGKKFSAQVIGLAIAAIVVWLINDLGGIPVPPIVAVAFGTLASVIASAIIPDEKEAEE